MKPVSDQLYTFSVDDVSFRNDVSPTLALERCTAKDLGLKEAWLRDSIFQVPELAIGPCRAAGLTDDDWHAWQREYKVEVGQIDVLLVSSEGRVAVVETKLAANPEGRRRVLAQALDYLTHLTENLDEALSTIPADENGNPVANADEIKESVGNGDVLVIIASDEADPRATRLSQGLLATHLTNQWDLALVDVALYRPTREGDRQYVVVPHLRNLVVSDPRQVVRVIVEGESPSARIKVERVSSDERTTTRRRWDKDQFFESIESGEAPSTVRQLADQLFALEQQYPESVKISWGTGHLGSMTLKRQGAGLIELYASGQIKFRPHKFVPALGDAIGNEYRRGLEALVPVEMKSIYPQVSAKNAAAVTSELYSLITNALEKAKTV